MPKKTERTSPRTVIATLECGGGNAYLDTQKVNGKVSGCRPDAGQKQGYYLAQLVHDPEGAAYDTNGNRVIPPEGVVYVNTLSKTPGGSYEQRGTIPLAHCADAADFFAAAAALAGDYLGAIRAAHAPDSVQTLGAKVRRWFDSWADDPDMLTWKRLVRWYAIELACTSPSGPTDEELRTLYRVLDADQRERLGVAGGFAAANGQAVITLPAETMRPVA